MKPVFLRGDGARVRREKVERNASPYLGSEGGPARREAGLGMRMGSRIVNPFFVILKHC